jgi:hypothetical protein
MRMNSSFVCLVHHYTNTKRRWIGVSDAFNTILELAQLSLYNRSVAVYDYALTLRGERYDEFPKTCSWTKIPVPMAYLQGMHAINGSDSVECCPDWIFIPANGAMRDSSRPQIHSQNFSCAGRRSNSCVHKVGSCWLSQR